MRAGSRFRARAACALAAAALAALAPAGAADGRTPLPPADAPWEFLDASSQIEHPAAHSGFRAASEGDFDLDGDQDVIVVQNVSAVGVFGTPARSVLYMNENGRFVDRTAQLLPELLVPQVTWWANVHDFDVPGDGLPDIFVPGGGGERSRLYRNRGNDMHGVFLGFVDESGRIQGPLSVSTHCYHAHKGDFDRDGAMDMFVYQYRPDLGAEHGQNRLLMNRGGILVDETIDRLPQRSEPGIFGHAEDLDNDGWVDISQVNLKNGLVGGSTWPSAPSIRVLINDGTGRFPPALEQVMPERLNPASSFGTYSLDHADLNGDGWLDIYVINWGMAGNERRDAVFVSSANPARLFPAANLYYPEFAVPTRDDDGDHPVNRDLNADGRPDMVVAQFQSRPYVLMNESRNGVTRMVERTPPEVPTSQSGFRTKLFDANGDARADIWLALRDRNFLVVTAAPEAEPNDGLSGAEPIRGFPALRTGAIGGPRELPLAEAGGETELARDLDCFALPARAIAEGTRVRLRPAPDTDLKLTALDAGGLVVAVSDAAGGGVVEEIVLPASTTATVLQVDRQAGQGAGTYRLDVAPVNGIQIDPQRPSPAVGGLRGASSPGDAPASSELPLRRAKY